MAPSFTFDGRDIPFREGDTYASALHRAGVLEISRSMKYHRPRGLYCVGGSCASCFVEVDGVPSVPTCTSAAEAQAELRSQNRLGSARRDLLGITDKVYAGGFDPHAAFTRPVVLNKMFLKAVRFMSGVGRAPEPSTRPGAGRHERIEMRELIVGAGAAGLRRAAEARGKVLLVDEEPGLGGSARYDPSEVETRALAEEAEDWDHVQAWTSTLAFGVYGDTVALARGGDLIEVTAKRTTIAPGRHDAWPVFENNDLPGVLSLRGARRLLQGHGVLPGKRIVGHGAPLPRDFVDALEAAGGRVVEAGTVQGVRGGTRVEKALVDGRRVACDAVVCHLRGTPRVELFQQAGCELRFRDGVLAPQTDDQGRTTRPDIHWGRA